MTYSRLIAAAIAIVAVASSPSVAAAQGRCIRAYGTPACNTDSIPAVFARTGWRTTSLDHITFRVAEPQKEAAFYVALMGWKVRSDDGKRVVMDVGDWGTVVFRQAPADSFPAPRAGRATAVAVRAVVEGFGFDIEPWNAKDCRSGTAKAWPHARRRQRRQGIRELSRERPDGFDLQIGNGKRYAKARHESAANAKLSTKHRRRSSRRVGKLCGRPFLIRCRQLQSERLVLHQSARLGPDVR
jgi:catechol 2,3-dioxygenase-like lactoylglutathione lyase family enzyme